MSAEDRAAVKGGLTDAQFNDLMRVVRETVRAEIRAEFDGRVRWSLPTDTKFYDVVASGGGYGSGVQSVVLRAKGD